MGRTENKNKGFSTLTILLGVLVVVATAAVSVVAYQRINSKANDKASTNQPSNQQSSTSNTTTQPQPTTYFTITQWGVKAPYTGQDTFTYTLSSDGNSAYIISKKLATLDPGCTTRGAGAISRLKPSDYASAYGTGPTIAQDASQNPSNYTYIGGYYYRFFHEQAQCGSVSITDLNQANDAVKALVANLQPVAN